jgi:WD40 repeat protein
MDLWEEEQSGEWVLERILQRAWVFSVTTTHEWIISGSLDGSVAVVNAQTWHNHRDLRLTSETAGKKGSKAHEPGIVYALHVLQSASGAPASLVVGTEDGNATIWNTQTWECDRCLAAHDESVVALTSTEGSQKLMTGSSDGTIIIWSTATWEQDMTLHDHEGEVSVLEVFEGRLYSASEDCSIRVWSDDGTGWWECEMELYDHEEPVISLAIHQDNLVR